MGRRFTYTSGGAFQIRCKCGATEEVGRRGSSKGGILPPEAIARFFASRGWKVGQTARKDRCPECFHKTKPAKKPAEQEGADQMATKVQEVRPPRPGASEEPPREMKKDDRRIIFGKLDEVYIDERSGYCKDWNDERVSKELGCPRAWVAQVRDENFGPQKSDQSEEVSHLKFKIESLEKDAHALDKEAERISGEVAEARKTCDEASINAKRIASTANNLLSHLKEIRTDLDKLVGRS